MTKVEVEIDLDGTTTVRVNGLAGPACEKLTKELIASLGTVVKTERTKEFYATSKQTQSTKVSV